jgi:hypothetical protein
VPIVKKSPRLDLRCSGERIPAIFRLDRRAAFASGEQFHRDCPEPRDMRINVRFFSKEKLAPPERTIICACFLSDSEPSPRDCQNC